eukprot:GHVR01020517.1.p1 GENE.GHVR01020517.1~~GHVR01020517.1.p1  ORF type:complete len:643 (-),score=87.67 GHVR01020517.1:230-2158(-)
MDYEEDAHKKVNANRTCTDVWGLIVFGLLVAAAVLISLHSFSKGKPARLYKGINFNGQVCGVNPHVIHKPFLFWPIDPIHGTIDKETPLCVKKCPSQEDADNKKTVNYPLRETVQNVDSHAFTTTQTEVPSPVYATELIADSYCVPPPGNGQHIAAEKMHGHWFQLQKMIGSLESTWELLLAVSILALLLSFLFIFSVSRGPHVLFYIFMGIAIVTLLLLGIGLIVAGTTDEFSKRFHVFKVDNDLWMIVMGSILLAIGVIFVLVFLWKMSQIKSALKMIDVSGDVIVDTPSLWAWPFITSAALLVWSVYWIIVLLYLVSSGTVKGNSVSEMTVRDNGGAQITGLHRHVQYDTLGWFLFIFWGIVYIWVLEIIIAFDNFVVAYCASVWYHSLSIDRATGEEERNTGCCPAVRGAGTGLFHHLGSYTIGSIVICIFRLPRFLFGWASMKHYRVDTEGDYSTLNNCCPCVRKCYKYTCDRYDDVVWSDMVMHSDDFCDSAENKRETMLGATQKGGLISLHSVMFALCAVGVLFVTALIGLIVFLLVTQVDVFTSDSSEYYVDSPFFVVMVSMILSFFIASVFINLINQTGDTIVYCFADNISASRARAPQELISLVDELDGEDHKYGYSYNDYKAEGYFGSSNV